MKKTKEIKKINVDTVQFFQGFNNLNSDGKITPEEREAIIKIFTSKNSFGPGTIQRNEISYSDLCKGMEELPLVLSNVYKLATVWEYIGQYVRHSMLINVPK
jgi:hypothetical protein